MSDSSDCIIDSLFTRTFGSRNFSEKLEIIKTGRPTPNLNLKTEVKDGQRRYFRSFRSEWYTEVVWLCGCSHIQKLFCWPCFLFSTKVDDPFVRSGVTDMGNYQNLKARHDKSVAHVQSMVDLVKFGKSRVDIGISKPYHDEIAKHNKEVTENRYILKCLIDVTCHLAQQEIAFRGHDEKADSQNKGNYVELLNLLALRDDKLAHHLENSTVFTGTSKTIQNELIECISKVVVDEIKSEIRQAKFVSIMLDESVDISKKSQLSITVRYIPESDEHQVVERFIRYFDVSSERNASNLYDVVQKFIQEFEIGEKLIAQTYDGAAVMAGQHNGLQKLISDTYKQAQFVHCYAHQLNLVLKQSVDAIRECRIFFETLSGFATFFSTSSKRTSCLDEVVQRRLPSASATRWNSNSKLVSVMSLVKEDLCYVFNIIMNDADTWDSGTRASARGFLHHLQEFNFNFLLATFEKIFAQSTLLFDLFQLKIFDIQAATTKLEEFKTFLSNFRNKFDEVYGKVLDAVSKVTNEPKRRRAAGELPEVQEHRRLFYQIIDTVQMQVSERFAEIAKLEYLALLDAKKFEVYSTKFPENLFRALMAHPHGKNFDSAKLRSQLLVTYDSTDLRGLTIHGLYKYLMSSGLSVALSEVVKLCNLIITIPVTSASTERSFSALKRIKTALRSTQGEERLSGLTVLSIEKKLLRQLREKPDFYDRVIQEFLKKTRRMDFIYR
ncbi:zinc finger MYM-type protein 1-like [Planococcus citri]|uniref:zinc finger MYM-type protein 1-like n=1 Tax=Planococcus citri TaxID=170843 RepID=UPI0031F832C7